MMDVRDGYVHDALYAFFLAIGREIGSRISRVRSEITKFAIWDIMARATWY